MEILPQVVVTGLGLGIVYGLIGLTFTAIFNASKVVNFAQGDFIMLGALLAAFLVHQWQIPLVPSILATVAITAAIGVILYWIVKSLLKQGDLIRASVSTLAISLMVTGTVGLMTRHDILGVPAFWDIPAIDVGPARLSPQYILLCIMAAVLVLGYWYFSARTHFGRALRATGFDGEAAAIIGIPTAVMIAVAFVISGTMGGLSGFFVAPVNSPSSDMGLPLMIRGFVATIVGGLGNAYGSLVGGVIVGLLATTLSAYTSAAMGEIAAFTLLLAILTLRPQGIFGRPE